MNLFWAQLYNELLKMFARKRTYIGFGAFLAMECLILYIANRPHARENFRRVIEQNGFGFEQYFSGLTMAFMMLSTTAVLLGSLYLALVAGDVISKEVEEGTLRMMMCRPISRSRIIALKYISCVIYTFILVLFIGVTALAAGILYRGTGGLFVFAPLEHIFAMHETGVGLQRYFGALPFLALSLASITTLGFMFSCFNMKPAAATVVTLSVIFLDWIFHNIPYFESYKNYFLSTHIAAWMQIFVTYIPWWQIAEDYAYLIALDATFFVVALAAFQTRDFKA